jgi:cysteine/O-acetylserine efflux protein
MVDMPILLIPSFLLYCFVGGITPGPANLCSLGAALRYGRGPALRQWRGLFCGFFLDSMGRRPSPGCWRRRAWYIPYPH